MLTATATSTRGLLPLARPQGGGERQEAECSRPKGWLPLIFRFGMWRTAGPHERSLSLTAKKRTNSSEVSLQTDPAGSTIVRHQARRGRATRLVSAEMLQPGMDLATWRRRAQSTAQHFPALGIVRGSGGQESNRGRIFASAACPRRWWVECASKAPLSLYLSTSLPVVPTYLGQRWWMQSCFDAVLRLCG